MANTTPKHHNIYIDRTTGTWGFAHDIVEKEIPESEVDAMEALSDNQIREKAYAWEDEQRRS